MEADCWRKTKIVARTSGHPSRCRWMAGERASSRDARDMGSGRLRWRCTGGAAPGTLARGYLTPELFLLFFAGEERESANNN